MWSTVCPTRYRTRHFSNNSITNEDITTKFEQQYVHCVWEMKRNVSQNDTWRTPLSREYWCLVWDFSATASFRRDFGHRARPIWRRLTISYEGYLKGRFYQNKPRTIDALKGNITEEIQAVTADILARISQNMARQFQSCLAANGGHFQHMLWCHFS